MSSAIGSFGIAGAVFWPRFDVDGRGPIDIGDLRNVVRRLGAACVRVSRCLPELLLVLDLALADQPIKMDGNVVMSHCLFLWRIVMTHSNRDLILVFLAVCLLPLEKATAQFSGSRGGIPRGVDMRQASPGLPELAPDVAQGYIIIEGQAELRVKPTEIRIVLAVTSEAKTSAECKRLVSEKIGLLKAAWKKMGIADAVRNLCRLQRSIVL